MNSQGIWKEASPTTIKLIVFLFACAVMVLLSLAGLAVLTITSDTAATPTDPYRALKVTADEMSSDFSSNELSAENKYYGATIVSGTIERIGSTTTGASYVLLNTKKSVGVQCLFANPRDDGLHRVRSGQSVSICGERASKASGVVVMQQCGFIE